MPEQPSGLDVSNPFCTARLRPGTIDFVFEQGKSIAQLVDALEASDWRGQIVGGHGTGKSTLLAAFAPAIEARGRRVQSITLTSGQRKVPADFVASLRQIAGRGVAAIDGIEQLRAWNRFGLQRFCKSHGIGLLVASHRSAHLPSLYETAVDSARAWSVVQRLQDGFPLRIAMPDMFALLARHEDNLREALFDLYDLYEERNSPARCES